MEINDYHLSRKGIRYLNYQSRYQKRDLYPSPDKSIFYLSQRMSKPNFVGLFHLDFFPLRLALKGTYAFSYELFSGWNIWNVRTFPTHSEVVIWEIRGYSIVFPTREKTIAKCISLDWSHIDYQKFYNHKSDLHFQCYSQKFEWIWYNLN